MKKMLSFSRLEAFASVLIVATSFAVVNGQFCTNTCPPINFGTPVPALCEGDNADMMADLEKTYDVCYPSTNPILSRYVHY